MKKKKKTAPPAPPETQNEQLFPAKQWVFRIALLLFPFFVLLLLELFLRSIEYGGNFDLVIKKQVDGREYYAINRAACKSYFAGSGTVSPEPASDIFEIDKSDTTIRIFCLGESTMAGFPYAMNATRRVFCANDFEISFPTPRLKS